MRAVFFDAGGTLFTERRSRAAIYAAAFAAHGLTVATEVMAGAMARAHAALPREIDGHFRYADVWFLAFIEHVARQLGFAAPLGPLADRLFAEFADPATFEVFPDVKRAMAGLRREPGVVIGVISNWSPRLELLLGRLGLRDLGPVVASAAVRLEKPDPRIFEYAAERAGIAPGEALHIGDHERHDFHAARAAGMRALWLRRSAAGAAAPHAITTLAEVLPRLRAGLV